VYFLFLAAVRCFITLGMRVRDASDLDKVASFGGFFSLLIEKSLVHPSDVSVLLIISSLLIAYFAFQSNS